MKIKNVIASLCILFCTGIFENLQAQSANDTVNKKSEFNIHNLQNGTYILNVKSTHSIQTKKLEIIK